MSELNWSTQNTTLLIINIITATICTFVFFITIYGVNNAFNDKFKKIDKYAIWFTLSCITLHFILSILDPLLFYYHEIDYETNQAGAEIIYKIWYTVWCCCRINIYIVYIYRLHIIFKGSTFQHSKCLYIILGFGSIVSFGSMVWAMVMTDTLHLDESSPAQFLLIMLAELIFLIMDVLIIVSLLLLFVSPFLKLVRLINQNENEFGSDHEIEQPESPPRTPTGRSKKVSISQMSNIKQMKLLQTATKIALLVIVSLISSFMYQILWVWSLSIHHSNAILYAWQYTWGCDNVTNIVCLYLSYSFAQHHYTFLCVNCMKLDSCFLCCIKRIS